MKIAIIGGGNMGSAFARACIEKKICAAKDLLIIEAQPPRRAVLIKMLKCRVEGAVSKSLSRYSTVLLAVKPLEMGVACAALKECMHSKQLVISILAGIRVASLSKALGGHKNIIRCMPNTPAQLGLGMSVYFSSPSVSKAALKIAQGIFDAAGASLFVREEKLLDAATAVSGSGPAYVYYFIENMLRAAVTLGFSREEAELLVGQTMAGALALWSSSGESPALLRERVTSKGGTTAAALAVFESRKVGRALIEGMRRADKRCRELQKLAKI